MDDTKSMQTSFRCGLLAAATQECRASVRTSGLTANSRKKCISLSLTQTTPHDTLLVFAICIASGRDTHHFPYCMCTKGHAQCGTGLVVTARSATDNRCLINLCIAIQTCTDAADWVEVNLAAKLRHCACMRSIFEVLIQRRRADDAKRPVSLRKTFVRCCLCLRARLPPCIFM